MIDLSGIISIIDPEDEKDKLKTANSLLHIVTTDNHSYWLNKLVFLMLLFIACISYCINIQLYSNTKFII